ncbi:MULTISPECIES: hypothetical protein [unclassified Pseudoclavibacter]|uniref:hypothetical protein n=1 Tax=unclassified Pseudoclavibacter TaxID=2615177 RepID=UPI0011B0348B|nr:MULTISPECIES: hypothetical protein [unclassified Pseudoclavibacter]
MDPGHEARLATGGGAIISERETTSNCMAVGVSVVDECGLPLEVTAGPITVELIDEVRQLHILS